MGAGMWTLSFPGVASLGSSPSAVWSTYHSCCPLCGLAPQELTARYGPDGAEVSGRLGAAAVGQGWYQGGADGHVLVAARRQGQHSTQPTTQTIRTRHRLAGTGRQGAQSLENCNRPFTPHSPTPSLTTQPPRLFPTSPPPHLPTCPPPYASSPPPHLPHQQAMAAILAMPAKESRPRIRTTRADLQAVAALDAFSAGRDDAEEEEQGEAVPLSSPMPGAER